MSLLEAVLLGIVQGLAEFLPISSSGHLVLANSWLGVDASSNDAWAVVVHLASALAIAVFFLWDWRVAVRRLRANTQTPDGGADAGPQTDRGTLSPLVGGGDVSPRTAIVRWGLLLAIATVPAGVAYLLAGDALDGVAFQSPLLVGVALLVNGGILLLVERVRPRGSMRVHEGTRRSVGRLMLVGVAQALALVPGLSRSGLTITAGLAVGLERAEAVRFSFALGFVAILAATAVKTDAILTLGDGLGWDVVIASFVASFVVSLVSLSLLFALVKGMRLWPFAVYCWIVGLVTIATSVLG